MTVEQTHQPYVKRDGTIVRHGVCTTEQEKADLPGPIAPGSTIYVTQTDKDYIWTGTQWRDKAPPGGQHDHDADYAPQPHEHDAIYSDINHDHGETFEAFPVGSVFISVVATNPATLLGYGTWSAFATGRMLVGLDAADPDFDTVEETGGAKTVTLTTNEMPAHTHVENQNSATTGPLAGWGARDTSTNTPIASSYSTASTGGGQAHPNLPPYIVCRMWKRTA